MIGKSDTTLAAMLWEEGLAPPTPPNAGGHPVSLGALNACTRTGSAATGTSRALDRWLIGVVRSPMCATARFTLAERSQVREVNAAGVAAGALTTFMAQRILANWRKYPKTMSVLLGPLSVEQHVSTQARDEDLWEMQRCNAFAVEFHR